MTDATALALAAVDGASGYAEQTALARSPASTRAGAVGGGREGEHDARRRRARARVVPRGARAVRVRRAARLLRVRLLRRARPARGAQLRVTDRLGEKVFDERFSLADDALDPRGLPKAFDFEGTPKQRVELVEDGVAHRRRLGPHDARSAPATARRRTGHAPPSSLRHWGPLPFALSVAGGEADSLEELAELVGDGIYVTRLHYLEHRRPARGDRSPG